MNCKVRVTPALWGLGRAHILRIRCKKGKHLLSFLALEVALPGDGNFKD
jgi:hypothetical protein